MLLLQCIYLFLLPVFVSACFSIDEEPLPGLHNGTSLSSRAYSVSTNIFGGQQPGSPWPHKTVIICLQYGYDQRFMDLLYEALEMWKRAYGGTDQCGLKVAIPREVTCENDIEGNWLHVYLNNNGQLSCTAGFIQAGFDSAGYAFQKMFFDTRPLPDRFDSRVTPKSRLAHELGHAFGLGHEQQRWDAWYPADGSHPLLIFHCENLMDYRKFADQGYDMNLLCSDYDAALAAGFGGAQFLPILGYEDRTGFDWNSIMIYPSWASAKTTNKGFRPVYTAYNGGIIQYKWSPTFYDGVGIQGLYPPDVVA